MSAFNAKNLEYNRQEPSFLRKLKAEHGGDRSNVQFARPKKDRLKTGDDDEDEPTIVDEHGESLGKGEWEQLLKQEKGAAKEGAEEQEAAGEGVWIDQDIGGKDGEGREKQQVAEIGANKKRKAVKVFGEETAADRKKVDSNGNEQLHEKPAISTTKNKTKKVKLSFDDTDGG